MILLHHSNGSSVVVIGMGLLGRAIVYHLMATGYRSLERATPDWSNSAGAGQLLRWLMTAIPRTSRSLDVVWSAGSCGFSASEAECLQELAGFSSALQALVQVQSNPELGFRFHLLSSAGGLFEGQPLVSEASTPAPRRPYGVLKLNEENLTLDILGRESVNIYRVSTVYSGPRPRSRLGLVAAMIVNMRQWRETPITGNLSTLRDFVYVEDVGRHIAMHMAGGVRSGEPVQWLISAKPSSIFEIVSCLESCLQRRAFVRYMPVRENAVNIVFSSALRGEDWQSCNLKTGLGMSVLGS